MPVLGRLLLLSLLAAAAVAQQPAQPQKRDLNLVDEDPAKVLAESGVPRSYALVVGVSQYQKLPEKSWLQFATRDAEAIYRILISPEGGNFRTENVRLLTGDQATKANLTRELEEWLPGKAQPGDRVLIYFAGHGFVADGQAYLAPFDVDPADIAASGYSMSRLGEVIGGKIQAKDKVLITDSCHSGAITPTAEGEANSALNASLLDLNTSTFVLTASRDRESSYEGDAWGGGHGVFTYYVVKGLEGEADWNGDAIVTADELAEYTRTEVRRATRTLQTPTSDRGSFNPNMLLAYFPSGSAISPAAPPEERYGTLVFESNKDGVELFLDGEPQGVVNQNKPLTLPGLRAGAHSIQGVKMGYEPDGPREEIVYPGQKKTVKLKILFPRKQSPEAAKALEEGVELYQRGEERNYRKAVEKLELALSLEPDYSRAAMYLGRAYSALFDYDEAKRAYEKAIEIDPDYLEARSSYGGMLLDIGEADEAIRQLTFVTQREKDNFLAWLMLTHTLHIKDLYDRSIEAAQNAIRLEPEAAEPHLVLADDYRLSDRCEQALPEYERYLELSDFQSSAAGKIFGYGLRGFLVGGGKKTRASIKDIWQTLQVRAYHGLGDCERILYRPDPAIAYYRKALDVAEDDPMLHFGLALALTRKTEITGDLAYLPQAREQFQRVVSLNPALDEAEQARGYIGKIESLLKGQ
ncbi:MAG: tetratricopeptide repeat protein [Acidobacteria bacterium]|nr:tetratricopeptide repeat protein [Acidobacteriota bacterium]